MKKITRYYCGNGEGMFESKTGAYVEYKEHNRIVKELEALLEQKLNLSGIVRPAGECDCLWQIEIESDTCPKCKRPMKKRAADGELLPAEGEGKSVSVGREWCLCSEGTC